MNTLLLIPRAIAITFHDFMFATGETVEAARYRIALEVIASGAAVDAPRIARIALGRKDT